MKQGQNWKLKNDDFPETFFKKGMKRMSTLFNQRFSGTPILLQTASV
jgi:hypothetical protein